MARSLKVTELAVLFGLVLILDVCKGQEGWKRHRRMGRSVALYNLDDAEIHPQFRVVRSAPAKSIVGHNLFKSKLSGLSDSTSQHLRQKRDASYSDTMAEKAAGYVEEGSAGVSVLSQLGSSGAQMAVDQATKGIGDGMNDAGKMFSDAMFDGGASAADSIRENAQMFGGK